MLSIIFSIIQLSIFNKIFMFCIKNDN